MQRKIRRKDQEPEKAKEQRQKKPNTERRASNIEKKDH